ncbi:MAG: MobF family relaxase [Solirubrobacterales bacterium]
MVGVTKIQRGNAGYWLAAVAEGGEDYYNKPGEAPGEWVGTLARDLGLSGQVDAAAYTAILDGRDPTSGAQLLKRPATKVHELPDGTTKRKEAVLGFDVRFSAPKSVSILYALGDEATRARVLEIVNEAVRQGIGHLEHQACFVRRGDGGGEVERGRGFAGMAFRHRMSRAGDPALHVHVVVSNLTQAAKDGKWLTLASPKGRSPLWLHAKSAGVVFQAELRAGFLREFGLEFEAVTNGYSDLQGFDRDVIEALSIRSAEIAEWMQEHGVDSLGAAQVAAYRTREAKDYGVDEDERRKEWIATAEPYGMSPESIGAMVAQAAPRAPRPIEDADLDRALTSLEAKTSHFDRRLLLWELADQLQEGASERELTAAVEAVIKSERVISVHDSEQAALSSGLYTTPRIAELEKRLTEAAIGGADAGVCQVDPAALAAVLERHAYLGDDQRAMVERLTTGGELIAPVAAWPGTGKTTALESAREAWEAAGFPVIGCAVANTAKQELKDAGIERSSTIASLLLRTDALRSEGEMPLARGTVIVVDEASMVATPDLDALRFLAVECDGKLVLIGDPQQIGAIGPGGAYGQITRTIEPATLTTIRRQQHPEDREFVTLIHEGRGSEALDLLRGRGRVVVGEDLRTTLDAMLTDWHRDFASGADAVMIARRNRDVDYLNDQARELRRAAGALGENEVIVGERGFASGDRVQTRINSEGVANRERWEVLAADGAARTVTLRRIGGDQRTVTLGPRYLDRRRDDRGAAIEHAYAITKYSAQGKTLDRAYPLLDAAGSLEQELVAVSRGREVANVYAVAASELTDADLGPGRREVSDSLHDIRLAIEREGANYSAAEAALRQRIADLSPRQLAARRAALAEQVSEADPLFSRGDRLDREIKRAEEWLGRMTGEREALEANESPRAADLARASTGEVAAREKLSRLRAQRSALPERDAEAPDSRPLAPSTRLESELVEDAVDRLARRDVAAARIEPIEDVICETLGTFPHADPEKARTWHEGADAIASYRRRHGITDTDNPLGPQPNDSAARAERARVERRIESAQRRLGRRATRGAARRTPQPHDIGR